MIEHDVVYRYSTVPANKVARPTKQFSSEDDPYYSTVQYCSLLLNVPRTSLLPIHTGLSMFTLE